MPRIRTVKPEVALHEGLYALERSTGLPIRFAWVALWCHCDREGRFEWRPVRLKASILPYDDCDFAQVLDALCASGFIVRYEADNKAFGFIPSWHHHQAIPTREPLSIIPVPPSMEQALPTPCVSHAEWERKGKERNGNGKGTHTPPSADCARLFAEFWNIFPRKTAKAAAFKAFCKLNPSSDLLALIVKAVERQSSWDQWKRGVIPHGATWLNQRRWEDEEPPYATGGGGKETTADVLRKAREKSAKEKPSG